MEPATGLAFTSETKLPWLLRTGVAVDKVCGACSVKIGDLECIPEPRRLALLLRPDAAQPLHRVHLAPIDNISVAHFPFLCFVHLAVRLPSATRFC